jgi:hypothetical protein
LFVLFCAVSSDRRHSSYVDKYESNLKVGLLMKQSVPPRLAPYRRYLVASHEATDMLYREMCLAPYLPDGMVVAIAVESAILYYILN